MAYLLHSDVKGVVIPAVDLPHDEIYFHIFDVAIFIVSEKQQTQNTTASSYYKRYFISSDPFKAVSHDNDFFHTLIFSGWFRFPVE